MRPLPVLALMFALGPALALLAPTASAQQVDFAVEHSGGDGIVIVGSSINTTVSVRNDGITPITVVFFATGAYVQFSPTQVTVLPTRTETSLATIWGNGTHADRLIHLGANETATDASRVSTFPLHVRTFGLDADPSLIGTVPAQAGFTTLQTTTSYPETINMSVVSAPRHWTVDLGSASFALASNETRSTRIDITPPANASAGSYRVDVRANTSRGVARYANLTVEVHVVPNPAVAAYYTPLVTRVEPGMNATADVTAEANVSDTVDFAIHAIEPGWNATLAFPSQDVAPGSRVTTRVVVKVPASATPGVYGVNVSATLRGSGTVAYARFPVEVVSSGVSPQVFSLRLSPTPLEATPGSAVMVFPTMFNGGQEAYAMSFNATGPLDISRVPSPGRGEVRILRVVAPDAPGTYRSTITTTSDTGGTASAELTLEVRPFALSVASNDWTMAAGRTSGFGVVVNSTSTRTVELSVDPLPGWGVSIAPSNGSAGPGSPLGARVTLQPPASGSGGYGITIRARDATTGETRAVVHSVYLGSASGATRPGLSPSTLDVDLSRGENRTYEVSVRNYDGVARAYDVEVRGVAGWIVGAASTVSVPADSTSTLSVYVAAMGNASDATAHVFLYTAERSVSDLYLRLNALEPGEEIAPVVSPSRVDASIARGANDTYHLTIRNPNAAARTYELSLELPPGWWTFSYPQNVTVQANTTYGHQLYLRAEANATDGAGTFIVRNGATNASIPINLRVAEAPEPISDRLWISPHTLDLPFFEGENKTRSVLLQGGNNASESIAYNITLSIPEGWNATVSPTTGTLLPGGRVSINVSATYNGGARAELGVKISDKVQGDVAWIDLIPPNSTRPPTPTPAPTPATPTPLEIKTNATAHWLVPTEVVLTAGGSATATFHSDTEAGALRLVLPASLSASALVLLMAPDPEGGFSATFVVTASATAEAGPVQGARIEGLDTPFAIPVRVVAGVVPAAQLEDPADTAALAIAGSAAAIGGGALGIAWAHKRWPALFAALYTRLAPSQILQHPVRRRMTELVAAEPGIAVGELQKRLSLSNGVMAHHLHRLEKSGGLVSMMDGQWRRLYPVGLKPGTGGTLPERAVRALEGRGAVPATELAAELGVSRQALHYHLKKLAQDGRIKATVAGGVLRVELASGATA